MKNLNVILVAMILTLSATNVFAEENPASEQSAEMLIKKPKKTVQQPVQREEPFTKAEDDAGLIVFGEGASKTEATTDALRSAVEQVYGVFVSSNTTLLNDELVRDEIVSISSGNIRHYDYINEYESNGKYNVTLRAFVSISKLQSYAKSKGSEVEFSGISLLVNEKMEKLERANIRAAMRHLTAQLYSRIGSIWDYEVKVSEVKPYYMPKETYVISYSDYISGNYKDPDADYYDIKVSVVAKLNDNAKILHDLYVNTTNAIFKGAIERGRKDEEIYSTAKDFGLDTFLLTINLVRNMCSFTISDGINKYRYEMAPIKVSRSWHIYLRVCGRCVNFINTNDISVTAASLSYDIDSDDLRDDLMDLLVNGRGHRNYSFSVTLRYSPKILETINKISVDPVPLRNTTYINVEGCFDAESYKKNIGDLIEYL